MVFRRERVMVDNKLLLELCDILENHNRTGVPVMKATVGRWTEMRAMQIVIDSCREMVNLLHEYECLGEFRLILVDSKGNVVVKRLLDVCYDMFVVEDKGLYYINVNSQYRLKDSFKTEKEAEEYMIMLANKVNLVEMKLFEIEK